MDTGTESTILIGVGDPMRSAVGDTCRDSLTITVFIVGNLRSSLTESLRIHNPNMSITNGNVYHTNGIELFNFHINEYR